MIQTPTVLFLGAGASAPYQIPLGPRLVADIAGALDPSRSGFLRRPTQALPSPDGGLVSSLAVDEFVENLKGSRLDSIDAFLEGNTDVYQLIGRAAIAGTILRRESDAQRAFDGGPIKDDWLRLVWNRMRASTDSSTFSENQLKVVTFNYDRVVEHFFSHALANAFNLQLRDADELRADTFEVIHLHGVVAEAHAFGSDVKNLDAKQLGVLADGIRVVHGDAVGDDPAFSSAISALEEAESVCVLGFGFHPDNVERLELGRVLQGKNLFATGYDLQEAERRRARNLLLQHDFTIGDLEDGCRAFLRKHVMLD